MELSETPLLSVYKNNTGTKIILFITLAFQYQYSYNLCITDINKAITQTRQYLMNTLEPGVLIYAFGSNECFWPAIITASNPNNDWLRISGMKQFLLLIFLNLSNVHLSIMYP